MPMSINSLAGGYRQRDNPRWSRAHQVKILGKMHKGVTQRALRQLRQGPAALTTNHSGQAHPKLQLLPAMSPVRGSKMRLPLYTENEEITECMRRRGKASLLKHPPVSVEHRMAGRDLVVPVPESVLDVNMFISNTGNITHKKDIFVGLRESTMHNMDEMAKELQKLDELIHHQAAGRSTNTSIAKFRAHFTRANLFYSMAGIVTSASEDHLDAYRSKTKQSPVSMSARDSKQHRSSSDVGTVEEYMRSALQDICIALRLEPGIAPAYFNRALYLRKLRCHDAALGDVTHALVLLSNDIGDNETAKIKYMRLAGILEREIGLFVESGLEYQRVKAVMKEQLEIAAAKRRKLAAERLKRRQEALGAAGFLKRGGGIKGGFMAGMANYKKRSMHKAKSVTQLHAIPGKSAGIHAKAKQSMLSVVHQATGGKHLRSVHDAKQKFLRGLLSPIAQSMAGTVPGQRSPSQVDRIMKFVHSTRSDDLISLGTATLRKVCQWIEHTSCAAGRYVFHQGDPQDAFYVLASGMATVMVNSPKINHEVPVKQLHPGDSFGKIYFPTVKEIEALEKRNERLVDWKSRDSIEDHSQIESLAPEKCKAEVKPQRLKRQSSVLAKAWATDQALGSTSSTRRAGIYANRHCELLILRWNHAAQQREKLNAEADKIEEKQTSSKNTVSREEAIREFQNHTILRRFNILRKCHVFKFLKNRDLERLATIGSIHSWHQGNVLVRQDEIMSRVLVLFRGVCHVQKRRPRLSDLGIRKAKYSPTGQGEDPLDVGMLWQQQYQQHLKSRSKLLNLAIKHQQRELSKDVGEEKGSKGKGEKDTWVKVGTVTAGDICCEMVLLNPSKSTASPVQIVADTSVDALVFSLGELKPFINHGIFSGRTRNLLVNSVGSNVPCEMKVQCNMTAKERWNRQKKIIVDSHVWGHRHPGPQPEKRDTTELPSRSAKAMLAGRVSWVRRG